MSPLGVVALGSGEKQLCELALSVRQRRRRAHSRIGGERRLEMRLGLVEAPEQPGEPAERAGDRAIGVIPADHGVARRIGLKQAIKDFRVTGLAEIDANLGQHEHRREPVPVARHAGELVLGQAFEFRSRLVETSELDQRQLQPARPKTISGFCVT